MISRWKNTSCRSVASVHWALAAILILGSVQMAWAHTDPPGSSATGVGISLTALIDTNMPPDGIGDTPVAARPTGLQVLAGETVYYVATLSPLAQPPNAAFQGGTWTITLPDGTVVPVTPVGGVPCIGGTTDDGAAPGGRGDCAPTVPSVTSVQVPYVVDCGDAGENGLTAMTSLSGAFAHIGVNDTAGVGAMTPFTLECLSCGIAVDKQISCDGGANFVDVGLQTADGDGPNGCTALNGADVVYRWVVANTGDAGLSSCVLTDTQTAVTPPQPVLGVIGVGETTQLSPDETAECSDNLEALEPNEAELTCICGEDFSGGIEISATDQADVECLGCEVELTKEVSCAGGPFGDGVTCWNAFDGMPAEDVTVRYVATNTSDPGVTLANCQITDTNGEIISVPITLGDGSIGESEDETEDVVAACSDTLDAGEPDTGTVTCDCFTGEIDTGENATDTDTSDFECQTPGLSVTKVCEPQDGNDNAVSIEVANTGETLLENCVVNDEVFAGDCPATGDPLFNINGTLSTNNFNLASGADTSVTGTVSGLTDDSCNQVTVTCDITGTNKQISNTADDLCEAGGEGCFTRTPGFWGTHPETTALFVPLASTCGFAVTNAPEAIQDMCVSNQEAKPNDTTQTHLQLMRQCTAALLNINATTAAEGDCESEFPGINDTLATCCFSNLCEQDSKAVAASGCIETLDAFNNDDFDGNELEQPFESSPANPEACQAAGNDGVLNPRNYGGK